MTFLSKVGMFLLLISPTADSPFRNILSQALVKLHKSENVTEAPNNCNKSGNLWETGKR